MEDSSRSSVPIPFWSSVQVDEEIEGVFRSICMNEIKRRRIYPQSKLEFVKFKHVNSRLKYSSEQMTLWRDEARLLDETRRSDQIKLKRLADIDALPEQLKPVRMSVTITYKADGFYDFIRKSTCSMDVWDGQFDKDDYENGELEVDHSHYAKEI